jgi:nuclear-control-of-ATPase protein 2
MDAVVQNVSDADLTVDKLDDAVATATQDDPYYELHESSGERTATSLKPADVAIRLQELLKNTLPTYSSNFNAAVKKNGRPSRLIRYWLPAAVLLVCGFPRAILGIREKDQMRLAKHPCIWQRAYHHSDC